MNITLRASLLSYTDTTERVTQLQREVRGPGGVPRVGDLLEVAPGTGPVLVRRVVWDVDCANPIVELEELDADSIDPSDDAVAVLTSAGWDVADAEDKILV